MEACWPRGACCTWIYANVHECLGSMGTEEATAAMHLPRIPRMVSFHATRVLAALEAEAVAVEVLVQVLASSLGSSAKRAAEYGKKHGATRWLMCAHASELADESAGR